MLQCCEHLYGVFGMEEVMEYCLLTLTQLVNALILLLTIEAH